MKKFETTFVNQSMMRRIPFPLFLVFTWMSLVLMGCEVNQKNWTSTPQTTVAPPSSAEGNDPSSSSHTSGAKNTSTAIIPETPVETGIDSNPTPKIEPTQNYGTPSPFVWELFDPGDLWEDVEPKSYLQDACAYLQMRWDPEKSHPGTIVAPIMFHSVRKSGRQITDSTSISEEYFHAVLTHALDLGYETITSEELIAFLTKNAKIPERSMFMVLDDRRPGVTERFIPYLEKNDWTLTLGWIIEDQREYLWKQMEDLYTSGRLDVQSHGYWHRYIVEETSEEVIREELFSPIPIIEEHFGKPPIIFIWPGGNFTSQSVELAHEAGYQLAFTAYARGPLMFNWIPQAEEESKIGDPLMTLPRFWSTTAWINLEQTIAVGQEALAQALEKYPEEAAWYRANCAGELPPPPVIEPTETQTPQ